MKTRRAVVWIAFLAAANAVAEVPQEAIDKLVELRVQQAELNMLRNSGQIERAEASRRAQALAREENAALQPVRRASGAEQTAAMDRISATAKMRVSVLQPQWQAQVTAFKDAEKKRTDQLKLDLEADARRALEFQREQMRATQAQAAGTIAQDEFTRRQTAALNSIMSLREKYSAEGPQWGQEFDRRLNLLAQALNGNPDTDLPAPQVAANSDQPLDFDADA